MKRRIDLNLSGVDLVAAAAAADASVVPAEWSPPTVLPPAWELIIRSPDGAKYMSELLNLAAIISCRIEADGRPWIHLSVSHRVRVPSWREMRECKELFLGDREAYSVLPPKARYVNIHPNVLHLFALLDGAPALPDFTSGTGSL